MRAMEGALDSSDQRVENGHEAIGTEVGTDGAWAPVPIDIEALAGAKSLLDEACPLGRATRR